VGHSKPAVWYVSFVLGCYSWLDHCALAWLLRENNLFIHVTRNKIRLISRGLKNEHYLLALRNGDLREGPQHFDFLIKCECITGGLPVLI
jgi:hypothetical protein